MRTPRAVLFDMDGTLVNTAPDFVIAANKLRTAHDLPPMQSDTISRVVSNGAAAVTETALELKDREGENFETQRKQLLEFYWQALGAGATLYPTLDNCLLELERRSIGWGIVTNKPLRYAEALVKKLGLDRRCGSLVCPDHVENAKPDPEGIHLAAKQLDLDAAQCIYVGDHLRDIDAGKRAGCSNIAVSYGYMENPSMAEHWEADYLVETPELLSELLLNLLP